MHKRRDQNPSIVPEDQMLVASQALASLKLALAIFPWLGVQNRRLIEPTHSLQGVFRARGGVGATGH